MVIALHDKLHRNDPISRLQNWLCRKIYTGKILMARHI